MFWRDFVHICLYIAIYLFIYLLDGCQSHTTGLLIAYLAMAFEWSIMQNDKFTNNNNKINNKIYLFSTTDIKYSYLGIFILIILILMFFWKRLRG